MTVPASANIAKRQLLERYKHVRDDHLRYMQKWGLIRAAHRENGESLYSFLDMAVVRQADEALADGATFRSVLRSLLASRDGQLAFDFRIEAQPAKVLQLRRREPPPMAALMIRSCRRGAAEVGTSWPRDIATGAREFEAAAPPTAVRWRRFRPLAP